MILTILKLKTMKKTLYVLAIGAMLSLSITSFASGNKPPGKESLTELKKVNTIESIAMDLTDFTIVEIQGIIDEVSPVTEVKSGAEFYSPDHAAIFVADKTVFLI